MEFFCQKRLVIGGSILMFFFRFVRIDIKVICKTYFLKQKNSQPTPIIYIAYLVMFKKTCTEFDKSLPTLRKTYSMLHKLFFCQ